MTAIAVIRLFGDYFVSGRADVNDWRTLVSHSNNVSAHAEAILPALPP